MNRWLTKWRISRALDERKPLPLAVERALTESAELGRFAANATAVDQALKKTQSVPKAPDSLHASIMRAVRSTESVEDFGRQISWPRLIPAAALTAVMILSVLGVLRYSHPPVKISPPAEESSLAIASSALETGNCLVRTVPEAALSPLSDEILRLNRDLTNAQNYLLATLP